MRIAIGQLWQESNTLNPLATTLGDFEAFGIHEGFYVFLLITAAANLAIAVVATQGGIGAFELVVSKTVIRAAVLMPSMVRSGQRRSQSDID